MSSKKYPRQAVEEKWRQLFSESAAAISQGDLAAQSQLRHVIPWARDGGEASFWRRSVLADVYARFQRHSGRVPFQAHAVDGFAGLPGNDPAQVAEFSSRLALGVDSDSVVDTTTPEFYRFAQWFFLELLEQGHASLHQRRSGVHQAPATSSTSGSGIGPAGSGSGAPDGSASSAESTERPQWRVSLAAHAERLFADVEKSSWSSESRKQQKSLIGRRRGVEVLFPVSRPFDEDYNQIGFFTTKIEAINGVTFLLISPRRQDVIDCVTDPDYVDEIAEFQQSCFSGTADRISGVRTGGYAINPLSLERLPIVVSPLADSRYSEGLVLGIPAHDAEQFELARKIRLRIREVINSSDASFDHQGRLTAPWEGEGVLTNSGALNGMSQRAAREKVFAQLSHRGMCEKTTQYALTNLPLSELDLRGPPVPVLHCVQCGVQPVAKQDLPVVLPDAYEAGDSLDDFPDFLAATCPTCGMSAKRDNGTLLPWLGLAWSFFIQATKSSAYERSLVDLEALAAEAAAAAAREKAAAEKAAAEKAAAEKAEAERIAAEKAAAEKAAAEQAAAEKAEAERLAAEQAAEQELSEDAAPDESADEDASSESEASSSDDDESEAVDEGDADADAEDSELAATAEDDSSEDASSEGDASDEENSQEEDSADEDHPSADEDVASEDGGADGEASSDDDDAVADEEASSDDDDDDTSDESDDESDDSNDESENSESDGDNSDQDSNSDDADGSTGKRPKRRRRRRRRGDAAEALVEAAPPKPVYRLLENDYLSRLFPADVVLAPARLSPKELVAVRFATKFLYDAKQVPVFEPFRRFYRVGDVDLQAATGSSNERELLDQAFERFGCDAMRVTLLSRAPAEQPLAFSVDDFYPAARLLQRIWHECQVRLEKGRFVSRRVLEAKHLAIFRVTERLKRLRFHTAWAALVEFVNFLRNPETTDEELDRSALETFVVLLSPFAPVMAQELWSQLDHEDSVFAAEWPAYSEEIVSPSDREIPVWVSGKIRDRIVQPVDLAAEHLESLVMEREAVRDAIGLRPIKRVVTVPGKVVSISLETSDVGDPVGD